MITETLELNKIYNMDCLQGLKMLPDNYIDCVVTSPPYNLGGDFHICNNGKRTTYGGYQSFADNMTEKEFDEFLQDVGDTPRTPKERGEEK